MTRRPIQSAIASAMPLRFAGRRDQVDRQAIESLWMKLAEAQQFTQTSDGIALEVLRATRKSDVIIRRGC